MGWCDTRPPLRWDSVVAGAQENNIRYMIHTNTSFSICVGFIEWLLNNENLAFRKDFPRITGLVHIVQLDKVTSTIFVFNRIHDCPYLDWGPNSAQENIRATVVGLETEVIDIGLREGGERNGTGGVFVRDVADLLEFVGYVL